MREMGVELYSIENEGKSSVAERWNRTMKGKMFKYFTANNTSKYPANILTFLTTLLRDTTTPDIHPVEASKKMNELTIYRNLYPDFERRPMKAKFKIGDKVGIHKKKKLFEKASPQIWQKKCSPCQKFKEPTRLLTK